MQLQVEPSLSRPPDEVYDLLEQMTINSFQWPSERARVKKHAGMYSIDPITSLTAQVSALVTQIATMSRGAQPNSEVAAVVSTNERPNIEEARYVNNHEYGGYRGNHVPNQYHHGLRNHENFFLCQ